MSNLEYLKVSLPEDILKFKYYGDFDGAIRLIDNFLARDIPTALRQRLEVEKELMPVLVRQYPYSFEQALEIMQKNVKDFTREELVKLQEESAADWILINGKPHFQNRFFQTLSKTRADIAARLFEQESNDDTAKKDKLLDDTIKEMKENGSKAYSFHLKTGIKLKDHAIEKGKTIKVHLPLPAEAKQLKNIKIIKTIPEAKFISDESYSQRTAYFEAVAGETNEFYVEYYYENHVEYVDLKAEDVSNEQPNFETQELAPHIMFTPYIKELCAEIIGDERNPLLKARKIYDFITTRVNYTFMREYFTVENIPEYASINLKGDCGVQALLFITLCRCAKIPAKWQSGMYTTKYFLGNHDWAQFYIAPYGWLFADCSFGGGSLRKGSKERWNFYFGNIDPFRMPANSEFQHDFIPNKKFLRVDPYDNQRGEAEYDHRGLTNEDFEVIRETIEIKEI